MMPKNGTCLHYWIAFPLCNGMVGKLAEIGIAGLGAIQVMPLSQQKQQALLTKWSHDTEGESLITHTELEFKGGC